MLEHMHLLSKLKVVKSKHRLRICNENLVLELGYVTV